MIKPAKGVTGHIIPYMDGTYYFRVYGENHCFIDYDLHHCDLMVTICDEDSALYLDDRGARLDHSLGTLGL
jgi:hypothetical protein